jgi:hypothetical protein
MAARGDEHSRLIFADVKDVSIVCRELRMDQAHAGLVRPLIVSDSKIKEEQQ